jgi:hypothetical protein
MIVGNSLGNYPRELNASGLKAAATKGKAY